MTAAVVHFKNYIQDFGQALRPYDSESSKNKLQIIVKSITFDMTSEAQASAVSNFQNYLKAVDELVMLRQD